MAITFNDFDVSVTDEKTLSVYPNGKTALDGISYITIEINETNRATTNNGVIEYYGIHVSGKINSTESDSMADSGWAKFSATDVNNGLPLCYTIKCIYSEMPTIKVKAMASDGSEKTISNTANPTENNTIVCKIYDKPIISNFQLSRKNGGINVSGVIRVPKPYGLSDSISLKYKSIRDTSYSTLSFTQSPTQSATLTEYVVDTNIVIGTFPESAFYYSFILTDGISELSFSLYCNSATQLFALYQNSVCVGMPYPFNNITARLQVGNDGIYTSGKITGYEIESNSDITAVDMAGTPQKITYKVAKKITEILSSIESLISRVKSLEDSKPTEVIKHGTKTGISIPANSAVTSNITFSVPFAKTPEIVVTVLGGVNINATVSSVSTTGATVRLYNTTSAEVTRNYAWIGIG